MTNRLFVGNLAWEARASDIRDVAESLGFVVNDVFVPTDRTTGRPRGFAFLELNSDQAATRAAAALSGALLAGRPLRVDMARARAPVPLAESIDGTREELERPSEQLDAVADGLSNEVGTP